MSLRRGAVTLCIPAHNEAAGIGRTLDQACAMSCNVVDEIIVCASGCSDQTAAIVRARMSAEDRLSLIEELVGKNRAWNALVLAAKNPVVVFMDADIASSAEAIAAVARRCSADSRVVIAMGVDVAQPQRRRLRDRFLALLCAPLARDYFCARLYALDLPALAEVFTRHGLAASPRPRLPLDLVVEDLWLSYLLEDAEMCVVNEAAVGYDPGTFADFLRTLARNDAAWRQLEESYPWLYSLRRNRFPVSGNWMQIAVRRLNTLPRPAVRAVVGTCLRAIVRILFRRAIARHRERMTTQVHCGRGGEILAGLGRVQNKSSRA